MNILTTGLPYANGALHIGHIYEWVLADSLTRLSCLTAHPQVWVSGDDAHGVAVSNAASCAQTPAQLWVDALTQKRRLDLQSLSLDDSHYLSTATTFHHEFVQKAYLKLQSKGFIQAVATKQYFAEVALFERDVIGLCPYCQTEQYLGVCENCQRDLNAGDLLHPRHSKTGEHVSLQDIELDHFKWGLFKDGVSAWIEKNAQPHLKAKLLFDLNELPDLWCIERCGEYFGIQVPGKDTHFYVWFDALLGYFSFAQHLGYDIHVPFAHILGKDILAFHALRLPALCVALDLPLPKPLIVHGHIVAADRSKFSKSRSNAPDLEDLRSRWGDDVLRYYFLKNTRGTTEDIPLLTNGLSNTKSQLANTIGNTFRRLHKIGFHHPLRPLSQPWQDQIDAWDARIEKTFQTGNVGGYLDQGEQLLQKLQSAIQQGKWWDSANEHEAQEGYALICAIIERLSFVLPSHLGQASQQLGQGLPLNVDAIFFVK